MRISRQLIQLLTHQTKNKNEKTDYSFAIIISSLLS